MFDQHPRLFAVVTGASSGDGVARRCVDSATADNSGLEAAQAPLAEPAFVAWFAPRNEPKDCGFTSR